MELSAELMLGFVRRVKILDQENRSTEAAMKYAVEQWRKDDMTQKNALRQDVRNQVLQLRKPVAEEMRKLSGAVENALKEEQIQSFGQIQELTLCRERLAQIRSAEMGILHPEELEGKQAAGCGGITLENVLKGEPDFVKLAVTVNELYRGGNMAKARQSYANFREQIRVARELLEKKTAAILGECASRAAAIQDKLAGDLENADDILATIVDQADTATEEKRPAWAVAIREQADRSGFARMELDMKRADRNTRVQSSFQNDYPCEEMEAECAGIRGNAAKGGYTCPERMPERAWLGDMELSLSGLKLAPETMGFLNRNYPFLLRNEKLVIPYGVPFGQELNSCISYTETERSAAVQEAKNLALRLYRMHRPGDMRIIFADPVALGGSFAVFGKLATDRDENNLIGGQIWAAPADINRKLQGLVAHIADVNQQCLQGQFASLADYNRESFAPQGYRVLMLMDYPAGMTKDSMELLERIVRLGPKCGVFTFVMRSKEQYLKASEEIRKQVDSLDKAFRKWTVRPDLQIVFDGVKLPGQDILWHGTDQSAKEIDGILRDLRISYGFV